MAELYARDGGGAGGDAELNYWDEITASEGIALVFFVLFSAGSLFHAFQLVRYRAWHFITFTVGAFMMSTGYIFRYISIKKPNNLALYIVQTLCILLPPSLYAASIYMLYGRIVRIVDAPHLSLIRPTWVTKIFVASDAFAFLLQSTGGSMMTSDDQGNRDLAKNILMGGLFFQLASFAFFLIVSASFYYRVVKSGLPPVQTYGKHHWTRMLQVMYIAAGIIIIRCVFRIIEFNAPNDAEVKVNEIWAYLFDAFPMLVVQYLFNVYHAGMAIPRDLNTIAATKEKLGDIDMEQQSMYRTNGGAV